MADYKRCPESVHLGSLQLHLILIRFNLRHCQIDTVRAEYRQLISSHRLIEWIIRSHIKPTFIKGHAPCQFRVRIPLLLQLLLHLWFELFSLNLDLIKCLTEELRSLLDQQLDLQRQRLRKHGLIIMPAFVFHHRDSLANSTVLTNPIHLSFQRLIL